MNYFRQLCIIEYDKLLAKTFSISVIYLVVRHNSCGNSSDWKFF